METTSGGNFQTIPNPYIVGNPIKDSRMFFGREDDFDYIRKKVTGGKEGGLIVLCGTRRSGKTSILFQIQGARLGSEFIPVLIDMQSMTVQTDREFISNLASEIITAIGDSEISFERDFQSRVNGNPFAAFQDLVEKINTKLKGRKLILMFDEYELFETHIDKERFSTDILHMLANWMEHKEGVFIIFTGSDKLESRNPRYWEHFLGKALHRRISFLSKKDTFRLIQEPVSGVVQYDEGISEEIYRLTAGQPFYTQVLCQSLVDHLNESHKYEVTAADVEHVVKEIIENPLPQMIFSWSSLSDLEKMGLSIIAELSKEKAKPVLHEEILSYPSDEKIGYRLDSNKLREAEERLFHYDLLDKDTENESYVFKMDLWRQWLTRMHSIWQVIDELKGTDGEVGEGIMPAARRFSRLSILAIIGVVVILGSIPFIYRTYLRRDNIAPVVSVAPVDSTRLSISTDPPDAYIYLNEQMIGKSPIQNRSVPAKRTSLKVELAGYKEFIDTLELRKDEPVERSIPLEERTGNLQVTSSPAGAIIYMDRSNTGLSTPSTIADLSINNPHQIRLKLAGYGDGSYQDIEIFEDSTISIHHDFSKITYPLTVVSEPLGASIYLDGRSIGQTPKSLSTLTQGTHELELRMNGFQTTRQSITIPAPNNMVDIALTRLQPGEIIFQIHPYAELWINGELKEKDAVYFSIELDPGTYQIELRHPHYGVIKDTIEVKSEETVTKQYRLDEMAEK